MKVENLINKNGNPVANQFVIYHDHCTEFQSYETSIAYKSNSESNKVVLQKDALNHSQTTTRHLVTFLGFNTAKELRKAIKDNPEVYTQL